jgi:hypothetical protein
MAVSLAVKNGRLVKCIARDKFGRPSITDADLADQEWLGNSNYTNAPQHEMGGRTLPAERGERGRGWPLDLPSLPARIMDAITDPTVTRSR